MWMDDLWGEMVSLVGNKNERFEPVIVTHLCLEVTSLILKNNEGNCYTPHVKKLCSNKKIQLIWSKCVGTDYRTATNSCSDHFYRL